MIRKTKVTDVKDIHKLLTIFSQRGDVLPRSLSELYDTVRDYYVFLDEGTETIVGTCAMHINWEDLAEIRSLTVKEDFQGRGIGTKLVEACLSEAITLGIYKAFVLTYQQEFFERFGFRAVDKSTLPHKIWSDCIKCFKFPDCDEVAMILEF
jgi:amino-acid N-acetyltransferase